MLIRADVERVDHAPTNSTKSGGKLSKSTPSAPDSAPLFSKTPIFPVFFEVVRVLSSPLKFLINRD
jgi:hypothetical protein